MGGTSSCSGGTECEVKISSCEEFGWDIELHVVDESGRACHVQTLPRNTTIGEVKQDLASLLGKPVSLQSLRRERWSSKSQLDDCKTLAEIDAERELNAGPLRLHLIIYRGPFALTVHSRNDVRLWDLGSLGTGSTAACGPSETDMSVQSVSSLSKVTGLEDFKVLCAAVDWSAKFIALGGSDIRIVSLDTFECVAILGRRKVLGRKRYDDGDCSDMCCLALHYASGRVLSGDATGKLKLFAIDEGSTVHEFCAHSGRIHCVDIDWVTLRVASAGQDGLLVLLDLAHGKPLQKFAGHQSWVQCFAVDWRKARLLSGSADCKLKLWDLGTAQHLLDLSGHKNIVLSVSVQWDIQLALSGDWEGGLRLWNLHSGTCLNAFEHAPVGSLSASLSVGLVLEGGQDGNLRFWQLEGLLCSKKLCIRPMSKGGVSFLSVDWSNAFLTSETSAAVGSLPGAQQAVYREAYAPYTDEIDPSGLSGLFHANWNVETGRYETV